MAKKQNNLTSRTKLEEVNESLSTAAQKLESNKKYIYWVAGAAAVIVLLVVGYIYGIRQPGIEKAKEAIGKADIELLLRGNDSTALAAYEKVEKEYNYKPAERAALSSAIILYRQGKYKEAAAKLENYDPHGDLVGPAAQSLLGDCYVNLDQLDKALAAFDKAITLTNNNELYAPTFMMKKATVLHAKKNYAEEAAMYQKIKDEYPNFVNQNRIFIDKYIERANALAGK